MVRNPSPRRLVPIFIVQFLTLLLSMCLLAVAFPAPADAQAAAVQGAQRVDNLEAELVADVTAIVPGQPFRLGLRLSHDPHWHTYWRNPGDSGLPTQFEPIGPQGASFGEIAWPAPERIAVGPLANYGYEGDLILARQALLPASSAQSSARFEVLAQWLVCKDVCIPGEASLALTLPVVAEGSPSRPGPNAAAFDRQARRVPDSTRPLEVGAWQTDGRFGLSLPEGRDASSVEFFPYFEGVVKPAAPQTLSRSREAPARLLLTTDLAERAPAFDVGTPRAAGLVIIDDEPVEVLLRRIGTPPVSGEIVAVARVVPTATAVSAGVGSGSGSSAGGGLLAALGTGAGSEPAAAQTPPEARPEAMGQRAEAGRARVVGASGSATFLIAIFGAAIGGLLLNLMPCVFPVIGLKVMTFAGGGGGSSAHGRRQAIAFALGVVVSFMLLGLLLLGLRAAGEVVGWGFQMQSPLFVGAMALLFLMIGLNLFGLFEVGASLTTLQPEGDRASSNFWTGVVAVLVATPCTAPFMGSAVGFTLTSPPLETIAIFAALGVGMALPYLLLGFVPALVRRLPRPGAWLETFKQFMAFPMLATAAWLVWVLALQAGADGVLHLLFAAIVLAFAGWLLGRQQRRGRSLSPFAAPWRFGAALVALALAAWQFVGIDRSADATFASGTTATVGSATNPAPVTGPPATRAQWQPWSVAAVDAALAAGNPVFVDFTAAWCISCQANKKLVLERDEVLDAFVRNDVVLLRADWTRRDPAITAELARHGRNGVPLYLWQRDSRAAPRVLPELLTIDTVLGALQAGG